MDEDIKRALTYIIEQIHQLRVDIGKIAQIVKESAAQSGAELHKITELEKKGVR